MLDQLIDKINSFIEDQKVAIRRTVASYSEKLAQGSFGAHDRDFHILTNIVLPTQVKTSGIIAGKNAHEWLEQEQQDEQSRIKKMYVIDARKHLEVQLHEINTISAQARQEQTAVQNKERQVMSRIGELQKQVANFRQPPFWKKVLFFWKWRGRQNSHAGLLREMMQLHGTLAFLRARMKIHTVLLHTLSHYAEYLNTHLLAGVKYVEGKLNQALVITESELSRIEQEIASVQGFQIDLHTHSKMDALRSERLNAQGLEATSHQLLGDIEDKGVDEVINILKGKFARVYEDISGFGAVQRLCELHGSNDEIGAFFQKLTEREGSPYCPLNDRLLDQVPKSITMFGLADTQIKNRIEGVVDGRVSRGSYGVSLQAERSKIVCLTSIHRIPTFAISEFPEYMTAVDIKLRYSTYAVYPERRWQEYAPVEPSTSGVQVDNIVALGFASGLIEYHDQGWYQVNGYRIRGMGELKSKLSADAKSLNRIKNWWLDAFSVQGINGVVQKLTDGEERTANVNGVSKRVHAIKQRLERLNGENPSRERFINVLTCIE